MDRPTESLASQSQHTSQLSSAGEAVKSGTPDGALHRRQQVPLNPAYRIVAFISLALLLILCVAWELFLDPLVPGGSVYVLKALPLLFPLYGVFKGNLYTLQWSSMLVLLYFTEGVVRWYSDVSKTSSMLGAIETILALIFFLAAILYVRPAKQAAKRAKKAR